MHTFPEYYDYQDRTSMPSNYGSCQGLGIGYVPHPQIQKVLEKSSKFFDKRNNKEKIKLSRCKSPVYELLAIGPNGIRWRVTYK